MEKEKMDIERFIEAVRNIAYEVHVYLGNGYLEKVYENCLRHRLEKAGYAVEAQKNLKVFDEDGFEIGDYFADLVVDGRLIIELKSVKALAGEHYAQTLNYLKITGFERALLINFGSYKFETRTVVPNFTGSGVEPKFYTSTPLHGEEGNGRVEVEKWRKKSSFGVAVARATQNTGAGVEPQFYPSPPLHG